MPKNFIQVEQDILKLQEEALKLVATLDLSNLPSLKSRVENMQSGGIFTARVEYLLMSTLELLTTLDQLAKDPNSLDSVF
jgi:hypothetical protein